MTASLKYFSTRITIYALSTLTFVLRYLKHYSEALQHYSEEVFYFKNIEAVTYRQKEPRNILCIDIY